MRKAPAAVLLSVAVPALTLLPVVSTSTAHAHAVPTSVAHVSLQGVDGAALAATGTSTLALSRGERAAQQGASRGAVPTRRPQVLTAQRRTAAFQAVGASWERPDTATALTVLVRTHSGRGWTEWVSLDDGNSPGEESPAATPRIATDPVYTGPSDGVQVRVDVRAGTLPKGLRLDLVDPGDSSYDGQAGRRPAARAQADTTQPGILTRAQWGADESKRRQLTTLSTYKAFVLHHTAGTNDYTPADVPKIIRALYAYDLSNGWSDIAYNVLVDRFGQAWEGRANSITGTTMSGATGGFNPSTYAVSVLGNFDKVDPGPAVVDMVTRLLSWKVASYHRNPLASTQLVASNGAGTTSRYRDGTAVTVPVILGHRDVGLTACPGRYLYPYLAQIRSAVAAAMPVAIFDPLVSTRSVAYQGGGVSLSAGVPTDQTWTLTVTDATGATVRTLSGAASPLTGIAVSWDGLLDGGAWAPVGAYTLTLSSSSPAGAAVPFTSTFQVGAPPPPPVVVAAPQLVPGSFVPLAPARLLDTRTRRGAAIGPGHRIELDVTGRGGVPANGVGTVYLNVTATRATKRTHLTVWPGGTTLPPSSSLNLPPRTTRAAQVVAGVGARGTVAIRNNTGTTDVVVDVVGYSLRAGTATASVLAPVSGQRIYDSRLAGGPLRPDEDRTIALPPVTLPAGLGTVDPSLVSAVMVNLTVTGGTGAGYLTAYPPGRRPGTSSLNFGKAETAANRAVVGVVGGSFVLRNVSRGTHVAVDVVGVFLNPTALPSALPVTGNVVAVRPVRVLDTRSGGGAPLGSGGRVDAVVAGGATGVPATAKAVLATLTGVAPTVRSHLLAYAAGGTFPGTSDVNVGVGDVRANLVLVPVGAGGAVTVFNNAGTQAAVLDVLGYVA